MLRQLGRVAEVKPGVRRHDVTPRVPLHPPRPRPRRCIMRALPRVDARRRRRRRNQSRADRTPPTTLSDPGLRDPLLRLRRRIHHVSCRTPQTNSRRGRRARRITRVPRQSPTGRCTPPRTTRPRGTEGIPRALSRWRTPTRARRGGGVVRAQHHPGGERGEAAHRTGLRQPRDPEDFARETPNRRTRRRWRRRRRRRR